MAFTLEMETEGAAFRAEDGGSHADAEAGEISRILSAIAGQVESGYRSGACLDANGNTVGKWRLD